MEGSRRCRRRELDQGKKGFDYSVGLRYVRAMQWLLQQPYHRKPKNLLERREAIIMEGTLDVYQRTHTIDMEDLILSKYRGVNFFVDKS